MKKHTLFKQNSVYKISGTILCSLFFIASNSSQILADEFRGTLNSVSITDATGTNQAPTAKFEYSKSGNTYTFDASKSSDPDGSIVKYKWAFDDGTMGVGTTIDYIADPNSTTPLVVTLTAVDDGNAVNIIHQSIPVADNFELIIDNLDKGFYVNGTFTTTKYKPGYYGENYGYIASGTKANWNFSIPKKQTYNIYMQWPIYPEKLGTAIPFILRNGKKKFNGTINQSINGGRFNLIGSFQLNPGTTTLTLTKKGITTADAIKITSSN